MVQVSVVDREGAGQAARFTQSLHEASRYPRVRHSELAAKLVSGPCTRSNCDVLAQGSFWVQSARMLLVTARGLSCALLVAVLALLGIVPCRAAKPLVFVHQPKTGGTTMRGILKVQSQRFPLVC